MTKERSFIETSINAVAAICSAAAAAMTSRACACGAGGGTLAMAQAPARMRKAKGQPKRKRTKVALAAPSLSVRSRCRALRSVCPPAAMRVNATQAQVGEAEVIAAIRCPVSHHRSRRKRPEQNDEYVRALGGCGCVLAARIGSMLPQSANSAGDRRRRDSPEDLTNDRRALSQSQHRRPSVECRNADARIRL